MMSPTNGQKLKNRENPSLADLMEYYLKAAEGPDYEESDRLLRERFKEVAPGTQIKYDDFEFIVGEGGEFVLR